MWLFVMERRLLPQMKFTPVSKFMNKAFAMEFPYMEHEFTEAWIGVHLKIPSLSRSLLVMWYHAGL